MARLLHISLLVGLLGLMSLPVEAKAECKVRDSTPTFTAGQLVDDTCDTSGNSSMTLGTLLNTEVPATVSRYISVGTTEDEHAIKTTAGSIFSITATNTAATVSYLKCENDTAANTAPGTDTPEFSVAIPGAATGAGVHLDFPVGFAFSNAWTCWLVKGAADSDVAEVGANEIHVVYTYK